MEQITVRCFKCDNLLYTTKDEVGDKDDGRFFCSEKCYYDYEKDIRFILGRRKKIEKIINGRKN